MWLAKDPSPVWELGGTIGAAVIMLVAALATAWFSLRGSRHAADTTRETEFDRRVDADNARLRRDLDVAELEVEHFRTERDRLRERYTALRLGVRARGLDPDAVERAGGVTGDHAG